jgi:hypothetical protein
MKDTPRLRDKLRIKFNHFLSSGFSGQFGDRIRESSIENCAFLYFHVWITGRSEEILMSGSLRIIGKDSLGWKLLNSHNFFVSSSDSSLIFFINSFKISMPNFKI